MKIKVIYVLVDTRELTLYQPDGKTVTIPQGDPRVPRIIEEAMPIVDRGEVAEVDIGHIDITNYQDFADSSNGLVRFFKVAKAKLSKWFGGSQEPRQEICPLPDMVELVNEVLTHAEPTTNAKIEPTETVVAVVKDTVIPGVEQLEKHVDHAVKLGSTKGMEAFLTRVGTVMKNRHHSVEDLLRFMERSDLPVADDGSIIAYKLLNARQDTFVDPHTGLVTQKLGSVVRVDESLVDPDRYNECSNGLHIARRGYLRHFYGTDCFLVKVAPEDVITVPHNDPNKVRVCAYHIVGHLSKDATHKVKNDLPMTDCAETQALLAKVIAGDHVGQIEEVRITKQKGLGLVIKPLLPAAKTDKPTQKTPVKNAIAIDDPALTTTTDNIAVVSPHAINKQLTELQETKEEKPVATNPYTRVTHAEVAAKLKDVLYSLDADITQKRMAAEQLVDLKKTSKKGWGVLGIDTTTQDLIKETLKDQPKAKVSKKAKALSNLMKPKDAKPKPALNDNILSDRDREVTRLAGLGKSKREIAKLTGVSTRTIGRILDKFVA